MSIHFRYHDVQQITTPFRSDYEYDIKSTTFEFQTSDVSGALTPSCHFPVDKEAPGMRMEKRGIVKHQPRPQVFTRLSSDSVRPGAEQDSANLSVELDG